MRALLAAAIALAGPAAWAGCPDLPGADALFAPRMPRIVWVGEIHGTAEEPALFGDLVCHAAQTGREVVVALERPHAEQPAWDRFLQDGDRTALLAQGLWAAPTQDGRSSQAMLALVERLRRFVAEGGVDAVVMMEADTARNVDHREQAMADVVAEAAANHPQAVILAYSGNLHARKSQSPFDSALSLAANRLPSKEVVSIDAQGRDGQDWSCQPDCGVHPYRGSDLPRGVVPARRPDEGYDYEIFSGVPMTASPPAVTRGP
jgi:hypothetical protein